MLSILEEKFQNLLDKISEIPDDWITFKETSNPTEYENFVDYPDTEFHDEVECLCRQAFTNLGFEPNPLELLAFDNFTSDYAVVAGEQDASGWLTACLIRVDDNCLICSWDIW